MEQIKKMAGVDHKSDFDLEAMEGYTGAVDFNKRLSSEEKKVKEANHAGENELFSFLAYLFEKNNQLNLFLYKSDPRHNFAEVLPQDQRRSCRPSPPAAREPVSPGRGREGAEAVSEILGAHHLL